MWTSDALYNSTTLQEASNRIALNGFLVTRKRKTKTLKFFLKEEYNCYGVCIVSNGRGSGFRWVREKPQTEHLLLLMTMKLDAFYIKVNGAEVNNLENIIVHLPKELIRIVESYI